jgi:hypothetical protein
MKIKPCLLPVNRTKVISENNGCLPMNTIRNNRLDYLWTVSVDCGILIYLLPNALLIASVRFWTCSFS